MFQGYKFFRVIYISPFISIDKLFCDKLKAEEVSRACTIDDIKSSNDINRSKGLLDRLRGSYDTIKRNFDNFKSNVPYSEDMKEVSCKSISENDQFYGIGLSHDLSLKMITRADIIYNSSPEVRTEMFGITKSLVKGNSELWSLKCDPTTNYSLFEDDRCRFLSSVQSPQTEYFVIGSFDDISCDDFIKAYSDHEYRKTWDSYTVSLEKLGQDQENDCEIFDWTITTGIPFRGLQRYVYSRRVTSSNDGRFKAILSHSIQDETKLRNISNGSKASENATLINYRSLYLLYPKTVSDEPGFNYIMHYYEESAGGYLAFPSAFVDRVVINTVESFRNSVINYKKV